ncbi:hypothetical protein BKA66DRAFT_269480 [Pyrenochaeta sp. MPI-SDFR-AT-0127]|nr:hypothetical protein BKA66DRAFT_269480 [Pyrenochaeta sp. MPI-SDFR-AT-0127]
MSLPLLSRLPTELHLNIIFYLELRDKSVLASTSRHFRSIIPQPSHKDFLDAETSAWARDNHLYACRRCVRFRRFEEFADDMKKGKRCRSQIDANTRFCLKCGVEDKLYAPGTCLTILNKPHVLCRICGILTDLIGDQGACARCLPGPQRNHMRFTSPNGHEYEQDVDWARWPIWSPRNSQEFYGVWLDA